jgi:hypothetical protein
VSYPEKVAMLPIGYPDVPTLWNVVIVANIGKPGGRA